jgi:hypothetical protein
MLPGAHDAFDEVWRRAFKGGELFLRGERPRRFDGRRRSVCLFLRSKTRHPYVDDERDAGGGSSGPT